MQDYFLMHKDIPCASLVIDPESERITGYHDIEKEYTPFLGHCDLERINQWWKSRSVPASREIMKCHAACSRRRKQRINFAGSPSPIVPYRSSRRSLIGRAARSCNLI